jgi:hypothetical protein
VGDDREEKAWRVILRTSQPTTPPPTVETHTTFGRDGVDHTERTESSSVDHCARGFAPA